MKIGRITCFGIAGLIVFTGLAAGDRSTAKVKFRLDASDLEERGQLKQLIYSKPENAITLKDMFLVEDDAPAVGVPGGIDYEDSTWYEKLHRGVMIRKDFMLDDPRAFGGYTVFLGREKFDNEHPLHVSINGKRFIRPATKYDQPYFTPMNESTKDWDWDYWLFVEIPAGALKKGRNECILWAESEETSWDIKIASEEEYKRGSKTRLHHPDRSAKSRDGGKTWDFERLGTTDEIDGEYSIRLSLDRSVPVGAYISPVIDIAEEWGKESIKKLVSIRECSVKWDIDIPEGSSAEITARLGENPVPASDSWSPYKKISDFTGIWKNPRGRYLQFKIVMKAENPLATPSLKGVFIETAVEYYPRKSNIFHHLVELQNGQVIRPSVEFTHEDFKKLRKYRELFELDKVVEGAATEFEAQLQLMRWAYRIPIKGLDPYAWNYYDLPILKKDDRGNIVLEKEYKRRRRYRHCLYCNLTLMGACLSMGYPSRYVNIASRSTGGHEVMEVWSNDFNKWVLLDATRDYYIYDPETGIPMNLTEINSRLGEIIPRTADWEYPIRVQIPDEAALLNVNIAYREGNNKYSVKDVEQGPHLLSRKGHLHMALRNDFASRKWPVPWRTSTAWGGNLFYGWYSDKFPRKREYKLHTNRWQDFNPPLNQSEITLSDTQQPRVLRVDVDTETPCFETFLIQSDGGEWKENPAYHFEWVLHEGLNRLRVRVRNTAGVLGPESYVSVVMND